MLKRSSTLASIVICAVLLSAFTNDPFERFLTKLSEYVKQNPTEKIHLHFDKPYYAIGDDIWFKAYVVDNKGLPSIISNILYVELINERDFITKQVKLSLQSGIAFGDFNLADSLSEGNYRIRAYTQWMRNANLEFLFDKTIKVGNGWSNKVFVKANNVFEKIKDNQVIKSTINLASASGTPYEKAEVSYEVILNGKHVANGKSITNQKGDIIVNIVNSNPENKSGQIIATITLANKTTVVKTIPIKATSNQIDVQFLPEGGNLIEGLPTKVAIKAINSSGLGENINCRITDQLGNEVSDFSTTHLGMGSFVLNPFNGRTYQAKITFADGSSKIVDLPKIEKSGYAIAVNNADAEQIGVKIMTSEDLLNKGELKLLVTHNGSNLFSAKVRNDKQLITVPISKSNFPSGIIQLSLFSPENIPVCERIIFVNNPSKGIGMALENLKDNYKKREKVNFSIHAINKDNPIEGNFSIAVTNAKIVVPNLENESNIYTSLLLKGDLSGYIEKPNLYFTNNDAQNIAKLDLLMLTQGWRKLDWKKINSWQPSFPKFEAEKSLKISGKLTRGGNPVKNGKVSLMSTSKGLFLLDTMSDVNGQFNFDNIVFEDTASFVIQARTEKNQKAIKIELDTYPNLVVLGNQQTGDIEVNVNEAIKSYVEQSNDYFNELIKQGALKGSITLKQVNIVKQKEPVRHPNNLLLPSIVDYSLSAKDFKDAHSPLLLLQTKIPAATVRGGRLYVRGYLVHFNIDGMDMGDDFNVNDLDLNSVGTIQVIRDGRSTFALVTLKPSKDRPYNKYSPGIENYLAHGYYRVREFYSPQYDVKEDTRPDLRSTVYWNPQLISNAAGKANISYFNTDQSGTYRIVIEGIDSQGNLIHQSYSYQVN